jgi:hypothetical protein
MENNTEVIFIGVAHQWHGKSKICSYEHIFDYIKRYNPDVIGVEIRSEDIGQDNDYLRISYPYEMIEVKDRFNNSAKVYGIDWLGEDIENKLYPRNYFKQCEFKVMQHKIDDQDEFKAIREVLCPLDKLLDESIMKSDLYQLNDGQTDKLCYVYYTQLRLLLRETSCEKYGSLWLQRDIRIANNIINVIKENRGKKILFLTGLAHRRISMDKVKEYFGDDLKMHESIKDYNVL